MENTMTMSKSYEQKLLERRSELFEQAPGEEAVEKREESVKHFRLGPGRYQAVVYAEPVHYKEEGSSAWKEIDNNLDDGTNEAGQPILRNRANKLRVELSKSADSGKLARIEEGGHVLEWSLDGMPAAVAPVVRQGAAIKQARLVERAQATPLFVGRTRASLEAADLSVLETEAEKRGDLTEKMDSDATYANVLPGLSVRYTLHGQSLKEDLILANAAALSYAALRLPDTYNYAVQENNSVSVRDKETGEEYFVFDPPLVYDAQGNETVATVALTPVSDGVRMSYALDEAFLAQAVFPVTIDPVTHSTSANKNTEFSCIAEGENRHYDQTNEDIKVGTLNGKKCVGMLRYLKLAPLESSDTIIQAQLCMYPKSSSTSKYIGVYPINKDWDKMTVNWANFDPYDEENIGQDAIECQKGSSSSPIVFDVTNLYRRWCMLDEDGNSQNFGVAFHTPLNIPAPNLSLLYSSVASSSRQPVMYLYYVSHAGLENWWQYESRSAGRAGTVYADLFNGNMVLEHTDTTMTGNRMPVSVSHYYNSCTSNANDHACGKGWKTSAHQKITKESLNGTDYFVWEDGDGTEHYFAETGSQPYKDQEGMDLELNLYESDGYIIIRDKGDNRMRFNILEPGLAWLVAARDALNNEVNYTYVSGYEKQGRISKITDPAGRETVFNYSGDLLANIRIPDTEANTYRYVYFTYDSSERLTGIRYSELGGTTPHTVYTYDGTTGILIRAKNYDGIRVDIGYEAKSRYNNTIFDEGANDQMRRVTSLETVHVNASNAVTRSGAKQLFDYQHMCTVVTAVENTTSDAGKKLYYQFNDSGNVVAMRDELGFGHFTKYEAGVENKPSEVSKLRKAVVNQLRKIDFSSQWTASEGTSTRDTSVTCMGMPSIKMVATNTPTEYRQEVTLKANTKYTFSAYVKVQNAIEEGAAYVALTKKSNASDTVYSDLVFGTTPAALDNGMPTDGWERVTVQLDHNASVDEAYYAEFHFGSGTGTAWFSCPQLETGTVANSVNLLSNADFHVTTTSGEQTLPADWSKSSNDLDTEPTGVKLASTDPDFPEALEGNYVQVEGRPDMTQYVGFAQELDISGKKNDVLVCGGWASAHSVPNADTVERGFGIAIQLQNAGGEWSSYAMRPFNGEWVGWQYASHALVVPGDFVKLRFIILYTSNCNYAKFTNLYLHREQFGVSYGYSGTDRRNVVSTTNLAGMQEHMEYDGEDNLTRYVQPGRENVEANKYVEWYGDSASDQAKHLLLRERTPEKVVNYHDYDSYGNRTSTRRVDYRVT
ncbi:MAG TPA: DNRLRE domain-containing protein, partial [Candidatus Pullichristensenella stercorigallinarum]|nr:DNRLRE domain-containing protein [Candidatus Pullichristensenella stercorigallinarum]